VRAESTMYDDVLYTVIRRYNVHMMYRAVSRSRLELRSLQVGLAAREREHLTCAIPVKLRCGRSRQNRHARCQFHATCADPVANEIFAKLKNSVQLSARANRHSRTGQRSRHAPRFCFRGALQKMKHGSCGMAFDDPWRRCYR
jgi:hypothetical protein